MKNKMRKRVMAGSMAAVLTAVGVGAYGFEQDSMSEVKAKDEDTKTLKEAAESVLGDTTTGSDGELYKDESVYVNADASGKVTNTTVTEWLKNPEKGTVSDETTLNDVKNVKGNETYKEGSGDTISWKSKGKDIYYQGTTDADLPVNMDITYKLNGKEIDPEDLAGKNGKLEMTINYENTSKQEVEVDGKKTEMYTPFTVATAMMLSTDEYTNVTIDNGKIVSDGDKNIVVGIAFPGLSEDLGLEDTDLDIDIPDSVTITADVTDASVGATYTLASANLLDSIGLDDVDSFDDLDDSIDKLKDATNQLVDGSKELADGSKTLADGTKTLSSGAKSLADGNDQLASGAKSLANGNSQLATGINTLNAKSGTLVSGVNSLADGVTAYTGGVKGLYDGSKTLKSGAQSVSDGAAKLNAGIASAAENAKKLADGATALNDGVAGAKEQLSGLGTAAAALSSINEDSILASVDVTAANGTATLDDDTINYIVSDCMPDDASEEDIAAAKQAVSKALGQAEVTVGETTKTLNQTGQTVAGTASAVSSQLSDAATNLGTQVEALQSGASQLAEGNTQLAAALGTGDGTTETIGSGAAALETGSAALVAGTEALSSGAETLYTNSEPLLAGVTSLKEGGTQLASGVSQLADGANAAADGAKTLSSGADAAASGANTLLNGTDTLVSGADTLASGADTLASGMSEYKTDAIDKLTDIFDGDIGKVTSRIDVMKDLSANYKSFAGIKDGMNGSTKFIIETEGVDK